MSLESRAYVASFPPPIDEDYLHTVIIPGYEERNHDEVISLTLKRTDVTELNLRTNDRILLVIQNNSSVLGRYRQSDTLASYPLRTIVRAKVISIDTNDAHKVFSTKDGLTKASNAIVHFIIEVMPPSAAEGALTLSRENLTELAPTKDSILTIIVAKKYRSPNKI